MSNRFTWIKNELDYTIGNKIWRIDMPLLKGKKNIGHNIKEEEKMHPHKQAVAIALSVARKSGAKIRKNRKK